MQKRPFVHVGIPSGLSTKLGARLSRRETRKPRQQRDSSKRPTVVILYVENVSVAVARIMRKHNVPVAMKPYKTLKGVLVLVHPKDKQDKEDVTECVYKVPCANCDKTYIGETGRKFGQITGTQD